VHTPCLNVFVKFSSIQDRNKARTTRVLCTALVVFYLRQTLSALYATSLSVQCTARNVSSLRWFVTAKFRWICLAQKLTSKHARNQLVTVFDIFVQIETSRKQV